MERKEPTLSMNAAVEPSETRRPTAADRDSSDPLMRDNGRSRTDSAPTRYESAPARSAIPAPVYETPKSAVPAIALVTALLAVAGAGVLGWQLFTTQAMLVKAEQRIAGLEQQLNLTSEESSASVVTVQSNLKKLDAEFRKVAAIVEENRQGLASANTKVAAATTAAANAKKSGDDAAAALKSLRQEVTATKTAATAATAKIDQSLAGVEEQMQGVKNMQETIHRMSLELTALDSLTARTKSNEEAISAIDDFRRSTNREILQIKQQLTTPK